MPCGPAVATRQTRSRSKRRAIVFLSRMPLRPSAAPRRISGWRRSSAMVLRPVARLEAENGAGVLEVAVAPPVIGDDEEDVEPERRRRGDAQLDHPHDVALTAPDRVVAGRHRPVFGLYAGAADADRGPSRPL